MRLFYCLFILLPLLASAQGDSLYHEKYRPQYHFTPAHRWIGDPCGNLKHNGRYMAYSWGAAESHDLVHWREINRHAIAGVPEGTATFTGSVAVDTINSAGYGKNAYIAAFTSFDEQTKKQSQSIAFSRDGGYNYDYYDLNPVIDIWSTEFRDPTVVRDEANGRWVMLVAKALAKKVAFYKSSDLKHWEWMSDFGPMGDVEKSWECPDMFRLPVDGDPEHQKWVLLVSVNWAREQYFVGDFDGVTFTPDSLYAPPCYVDHGLDYYASRVFADYDTPRGPVYTLGWVNTWDYAGAAPSAWGKGVWSLPREYSLVTTPEGIKLYQRPAPALAGLRGDPVRYRRKLRPGVTPLPAVASMANTYEMDVTFDLKDRLPVGLMLLEGDGRRLVVNYDPATSCLTLDRMNVTDAEIPKFARQSSVSVRPADGKLRLQVFVDRSTVEIFVNGGEVTLTALTYPGESQTGASIYSLGGNNEADVTLWPLKSIWR